MLLSTLPTADSHLQQRWTAQDNLCLLQPGNYFEAGISVLDADVSGKESGTSLTQRNIGDMADSYYFPSAALKLQVDNKFSFGLIYDQPFGAKRLSW